MHSPVLLIAFNRPDFFEQSLRRVLAEVPPRIYIHIDGPRSEADTLSQKRMVELVEMYSSHDTTIHLRQLPQNLGCGNAVNSALDSVFEHEARAVILEDDLAPTQDFFGFADSALAFYENDPSVGLVGGYNATSVYSVWPGTRLKPIHSPKAYIWGWATWRNRWQAYRRGLKFPEVPVRDSNLATIRKELPHTLEEISWGHFAVQRGNRTLGIIHGPTSVFTGAGLVYCRR